jgi:hypothetical protein
MVKSEAHEQRDRNSEGTKTRDGENGGDEGTETPEEDNDEDMCLSLAGRGEALIDLGEFTFIGKNIIGSNKSNTINKFLWETLDVSKTAKSDSQELASEYLANNIAADNKVGKKSKFFVAAGVMIETTKKIEGSPQEKKPIVTRIVRGNHTGLVGEEIRLKVTKSYGNATEFGFNQSGSTSTTKRTVALGYLEETFFNFGKGYGKFNIVIEWIRGGEVIETHKIEAESRLVHQFTSIAYEVNKSALNQGLKMLDANSSNVDGVLGTISTKDIGNWSIFGTQSLNGEYTKDIELSFSATSKIELDPEKEKTALFGLAKTMIKNPPKDKNYTITSVGPEDLKEVMDKHKVSSNVDNKQIKQFRIGIAGNPFVIELEKPVNQGGALTGKGTLSIDGLQSEQNVIKALKKLELKVNNVEVKKEGEVFIATKGSVTYEKEVKFKMYDKFEFELSKFGITADVGATIEGKVKHEKLEDAVGFNAEIDPAGNFWCELSDLPEIEVREFKLKKGSKIELDMHKEKNVNLAEIGSPFYGIVIRKAELELPKSFAKEGASDPTGIAVEDFYISKKGFGGQIKTKGQLVSMGFAGYEIVVKDVDLGFKRNELISCNINGELSAPSPMEGNLGLGITASKTAFAGKLSTDKPIYLPQFKTTFVLKNADIRYDFEKELGTMELGAFINSPEFGDIKIKGFKITSKGQIEAEEISVEEEIEIGKGFKMHLRTLGFAFEDRTKYALNFDGKVDFKGIAALDAKAKVESGPSLVFERLDVKFNKGPVKFDGKFKYAKSVFEGGFDVQVKKWDKGLEGFLIVGNQKVSDKENFGYWYGEIGTDLAIPIGQSGFSFLKFSGGVGYNYAPPIGNQNGSPMKDGGFSLKALVGVGNAPGGEVLEGEMQLSYIAGNFSMFGKAWLLSKEESMYGQGQINLNTNKGSIDGYIGAFIGLPDAKGKLFLAQGQINFAYPPDNNRYVWTQEVEASLFEVINADASLVISETRVDMTGRMYYDVDKEYTLGKLSLNATFDLNADLALSYVYKTSTGTARPAFKGNWDVNIDAFDKSFDIVSGAISINNALMQVTPSQLTIKGSANARYKVLWHSGSKEVDIDYQTSL